jgi:hypothetical protein
MSHSTPSLEKVQKRAVKVQEICRQADAEITILDQLIAQLETEYCDSLLYQYRLNKEKQV